MSQKHPFLRTTLRLVAIGLLLWLPPAAAQTIDTVILDGRVMDPETGLDAIRNVGILDGRIATITKSPIKGQQTIAAQSTRLPALIDRW